MIQTLKNSWPWWYPPDSQPIPLTFGAAQVRRRHGFDEPISFNLKSIFIV